MIKKSALILSFLTLLATEVSASTQNIIVQITHKSADKNILLVTVIKPEQFTGGQELLCEQEIGSYLYIFNLYKHSGAPNTYEFWLIRDDDDFVAGAPFQFPATAYRLIRAKDSLTNLYVGASNDEETKTFLESLKNPESMFRKVLKIDKVEFMSCRPY